MENPMKTPTEAATVLVLFTMAIMLTFKMNVTVIHWC